MLISVTKLKLKDSDRESGIFQSEYILNPFEDVRKDDQVCTNKSKAEKEIVSKIFSRFLGKVIKSHS